MKLHAVGRKLTILKWAHTRILIYRVMFKPISMCQYIAYARLIFCMQNACNHKFHCCTIMFAFKCMQGWLCGVCVIFLQAGDLVYSYTNFHFGAFCMSNTMCLMRAGGLGPWEHHSLWEWFSGTIACETFPILHVPLLHRGCIKTLPRRSIRSCVYMSKLWC